MKISAILAASENNIIGAENDMPWHIPNDLKWFKQNTLNKPMIMGRKTFQSLPGLLSKRTSIILTRDPNFAVEGAIIAHNVDQAIALATEDCDLRRADEIMIVGGGEIYRLFYPQITRFYLTRVHTNVEGDTEFFDLAPQNWTKTFEQENPADEKNQYAHTFEILDRV
ncbi:MAG: dihydrofolate reductase [Sneathiella sp.]|nr:dihydrofolate reductase [Sneathiella sp.]